MENVTLSQNQLEGISYVEKNREVVYADLKTKQYTEEFARIGYGAYPDNTQMDMIRFIIDHEKAHGDLAKGGLLKFAIICFNYGKMIGTREERARRKNNLFSRKRTA